MNRLYWETIQHATRGEFELIIVDNGSTDGSLEFFQELAARDSRVRVIANGRNYSYPYANNQGLAMARGEIIAFLNNDILLPPGWDVDMASLLGKDGYEVLTMASQDHFVSPEMTRKLKNAWKRVKHPLTPVLGQGKNALKLMARLRYGDYDSYCRKVKEKYGHSLSPGFCGSVVMMTRRGLELVGKWDERLQGADFDLMCRTIKRWREHGDVRPMAVVNGIYSHHFSRMTAKCTYPQFADAANLISIEEKWGNHPEILEACREACAFRDAAGESLIAAGGDGK